MKDWLLSASMVVIALVIGSQPTSALPTSDVSDNAQILNQESDKTIFIKTESELSK